MALYGHMLGATLPHSMTLNRGSATNTSQCRLPVFLEVGASRQKYIETVTCGSSLALASVHESAVV
jgi:hypothetical protein